MREKSLLMIPVHGRRVLSSCPHLLLMYSFLDLYEGAKRDTVQIRSNIYQMLPTGDHLFVADGQVGPFEQLYACQGRAWCISWQGASHQHAAHIDR